MEFLSTSKTSRSRRRSLLCSLSLIFVLSSCSRIVKKAESLGINYGQIADNLPPPEKVVPLVKSIGATKVKLYDADPKVLKAFANTGMELMVTLGNELLAKMGKDPKLAEDWVKKNVVCYLPHSNITGILIGNEVLTYNDTSLSSGLLPTMVNIHAALQAENLDRKVAVTTAHNLGILQNSYPPSAGEFREDLAPILTQIVSFHARTGSPFLINAYPYFAYKANPKQVSLEFVLFQANQGIVDPGSNLRYDNMLFAQIDAVYAAMGGNASRNVQIQVSETGWPSKGDDDEYGASPENAKKYNGNLIRMILSKKGTPMRPKCDLNIFIFALFNENLKPGPTSERNYGLFKPDGTAAYSLGIPTIQAVGNSTEAGSGSPSSPASGSSPFSTGYLSISSTTVRLRGTIAWIMASCDCFEQWHTDDLLVKYQYISDFFIAVAYFSIPLELIYFVQKSAFFPYRWVLMQFGLFIVLCGATHLINLWTFSMHSKTVAIVMTIAKMSTAAVSCITALMLVHIIPDLLSVKTREMLLRSRAEELDKEMGLILTQEETGRHVRMLTHEIRSTLDRHTILKTTLVELGRTLHLEECTLWMPSQTGMTMRLSHALHHSISVGSTVSVNLPVIAEIFNNSGVVRIPHTCPLVRVRPAPGRYGASPDVVAVRVPLLHHSNFQINDWPDVSAKSYAVMVLISASDAIRKFRDHELELVEVVADQLRDTAYCHLIPFCIQHCQSSV